MGIAQIGCLISMALAYTPQPFPTLMIAIPAAIVLLIHKHVPEVY